MTWWIGLTFGVLVFVGFLFWFLRDIIWPKKEISVEQKIWSALVIEDLYLPPELWEQRQISKNREENEKYGCYTEQEIQHRRTGTTTRMKIKVLAHMYKNPDQNVVISAHSVHYAKQLVREIITLVENSVFLFGLFSFSKETERKKFIRRLSVISHSYKSHSQGVLFSDHYFTRKNLEVGF